MRALTLSDELWRDLGKLQTRAQRVIHVDDGELSLPPQSHRKFKREVRLACSVDTISKSVS
jgi:hypothetical protein